jgi:SPP1 family predicted phage head-tail adaptor
MPQAGDLRDRITIKRRVEVRDATGGLDRTWETLAEVWAQVISINGREEVIGNVLQGTSTFQVTIRYRNDLKASDQILWNGRELNVLAAEDREGRRRWTIIHASTLAPQGA